MTPRRLQLQSWCAFAMINGAEFENQTGQKPVGSHDAVYASFLRTKCIASSMENMLGAQRYPICVMSMPANRFSLAHEDRPKRQMQFVNQPRAKMLNGRNTAADADVRFLRRVLRALQSRMESVRREVKRSPAFHLHHPRG